MNELHLACESGNLAHAKKLLTNNPHLINKPHTQTGDFPMDYAARSGNLDLVRFLNAQNGVCAHGDLLFMACQCKNEKKKNKLLKYLHEHFSEFKFSPWTTPDFIPLEGKTDYNEKPNQAGLTPLFYAAIAYRKNAILPVKSTREVLLPRYIYTASIAHRDASYAIYRAEVFYQLALSFEQSSSRKFAAYLYSQAKKQLQSAQIDSDKRTRFLLLISVKLATYYYNESKYDEAATQSKDAKLAFDALHFQIQDDVYLYVKSQYILTNIFHKAEDEAQAYRVCEGLLPYLNSLIIEDNDNLPMQIYHFLQDFYFHKGNRAKEENDLAQSAEFFDKSKLYYLKTIEAFIKIKNKHATHYIFLSTDKYLFETIFALAEALDVESLVWLRRKGFLANVRRNHETVLSRLALEGKHEAVDLLINYFGMSPAEAVYGYACAKNVEKVKELRAMYPNCKEKALEGLAVAGCYSSSNVTPAVVKGLAIANNQKDFRKVFLPQNLDHCIAALTGFCLVGNMVEADAIIRNNPQALQQLSLIKLVTVLSCNYVPAKNFIRGQFRDNLFQVAEALANAGRSDVTQIIGSIPFNQFNHVRFKKMLKAVLSGFISGHHWSHLGMIDELYNLGSNEEIRMLVNLLIMEGSILEKKSALRIMTFIQNNHFRERIIDALITFKLDVPNSPANPFNGAITIDYNPVKLRNQAARLRRVMNTFEFDFQQAEVWLSADMHFWFLQIMPIMKDIFPLEILINMTAFIIELPYNKSLFIFKVQQETVPGILLKDAVERADAQIATAEESLEKINEELEQESSELEKASDAIQKEKLFVHKLFHHGKNKSRMQAHQKEETRVRIAKGNATGEIHYANEDKKDAEKKYKYRRF